MSVCGDNTERGRIGGGMTKPIRYSFYLPDAWLYDKAAVALVRRVREFNLYGLYRDSFWRVLTPLEQELKNR